MGRAAYTELQLHPEHIDDRVGERVYLPTPTSEGDTPLVSWLSRMAYSRRQLQEKMALIWHEHFACSIMKVGSANLLRDQEQLVRTHALGNFRALLIAMTTDNGMLYFLDNTDNDGQAVDGEGNPIAPNENYARELLQLFSLGVHQLNIDGTPVVDEEGKPVPAYSESDVKEIARALTGWHAQYPQQINPEDPHEYIPPAEFVPSRHDPRQKTLLGQIVPADDQNGAADVERVVDIIMRHPSTAPFIATELIQKLATETPSPGYVARVARVFAFTHGDIRATVRAILTDAEFYSAAVVGSQFKTPVEYMVGAVRGLGTTGQASQALSYWTLLTGEYVFSAPSVFSFYRPGAKGSLVTAGYVVARDVSTDQLVNIPPDTGYDVYWDAQAMIRRHHLAQRPGRALDLLTQNLLAAPLSPETRAILLEYMGPTVTEEKLRGAAWLIMSAPEYQVN